MGLDTTHDCWHGAYGSFTYWRHAVARAAGYKIITPPKPNEPGYEPGQYLDYVDIAWDAFKPENYEGEWDFIPGDDPLLYLIVHSDCDGVIHPEQGRHIATRLAELLPKMDDDGPLSMRARTQQFIDGLRTAAEANEDVVFL